MTLQHRLLLLALAAACTVAVAVIEDDATKRAPRSCWKDTDLIGYENRMFVQLLAYEGRDDKWVGHLGVPEETFYYICELVRPQMKFNSTRNMERRCIVEERCAIAMYQLRHGGTNLSVAHYAKCGTNTVSDYTMAFCKALTACAGDFITHPTDAELAEIERGFESMPASRLPGCVGAIDGTHIWVCNSDRSYENYKGFHSIVLQAVVDHNCLIRDICVGAPGSWSDKVVLNAATDTLDWFDELRTKGTRTIQGIDVPYYILGDGIYEPRSGLMVPFKGDNLDDFEVQWNFWQSSARMVVERTFGQLKGRFKILTKPLSYKPTGKVSSIVTACCVLHNICILHGVSADNADRLSQAETAFWSGADNAGTLEFASSAVEKAAALQQRIALTRHLQGVHG